MPTIEDRAPESVFRELELILEAKKNINSIVTTMYSIFYSLEGFLLYGFYVLGALAARLSITFFAGACLLGLLLVTLRTKGTNDRCDQQAGSLERKHGLHIIRNYDASGDARWPRLLYQSTMHGTLIAVDLALIVMWIALGVLASRGLV